MAKGLPTVSALLLVGVLGGCASMNPRDPLEPYNRVVYAFNDKVDTYALKPIAEAYRDYVPGLIRTGVRNFFGNLNDVWIGVNNLLQGKVGNALNDWMRFAINSTFGLGGILDVAGETRLDKHNEDLGQTLGWWGVPPGPYFVIPFLGPSTIRDAAALPIDYSAANRMRQAVAQGVTDRYEERVANSSWAVEFVSNRAAALDATNLISGAALDPYTFTRDAFLQRRRSLVYDGAPPRPKDEEEDDDEPPPKPGGKPGARSGDRGDPSETVLPVVTRAPVVGDTEVGPDPASNVISSVPPGKETE